ncbi:ABSCISIC ACID-INSENSITIVE 5-like protein 2 [Ananas comosus]|uniref:ABSCISIC ACID-INSENSITIVE 5-like protein 2 n=1 Tax=Ananas comosus TaxID=4615 RepID=A0A199UL33_ANACO|nr:ABSCISIC ACID-INSENSITIVE 5-like protein 2 [Ananas comosus]
MGIQTMTSQGGGGGAPPSPIHNLAKQGSLCNLTLNEVQNHLGEPLHSMNLDELLKSVFPEPVLMDPNSSSAPYPTGSGLQRQGSVTMPRALSKKTVDEVWKDIQQDNTTDKEEQRPVQERQPTLGEMTLEDFLIKAGVVMEGNMLIGNAGPIGAGDRATGGQDWYQQYQQQGQQSMMGGGYMASIAIPQQLGVAVGPVLESVYSDGQLNISSPTVGGALSEPQTPGRKRAAAGEMVDKMVERRQKRMIKNRESAARSRARKQAYTNELENKVSRLEEENERLRKQKELDKILRSAPPPEPKHLLRRTSSAPI